MSQVFIGKYALGRLLVSLAPLKKYTWLLLDFLLGKYDHTPPQVLIATRRASLKLGKTRVIRCAEIYPFPFKTCLDTKAQNYTSLSFGKT